MHPRMKKKGSMPACLPIIKAGPSKKMSKYVAMMEGNKSEPYLVPMFHPKKHFEKKTLHSPKFQHASPPKKDGFPSKDFKGAVFRFHVQFWEGTLPETNIAPKTDGFQ